MSVKPGKEETMTMEAVDGVTSDTNETTVPLKNNPGRTFRDGVRKIDLILVVKDEENLIADPMKNNFLTNIVKTGLQIEFEKGVLPHNKKLIFFKVHCPNDLLNNLRHAFGINYVQIARAEHIMSDRERDWINLIRKEYTQPLQYSSLERSLIVYMTLLNVPFGDRQNYIGMERLIKRKVVIDAYALHDGPYFITQDASSINARQILFYNWVGITNIFTRQPLNLVQEYFGPKVALYFAYYGLYNIFLAIASIVALITLFLAIFLNENYMDLRPEFKGNHGTARKSNKTGIVIDKHYVSKIKILICYIGIFACKCDASNPEKIIPRLIYTMIGFAVVLFIIDLCHYMYTRHALPELGQEMLNGPRSSVVCAVLFPASRYDPPPKTAIFELWHGYEKNDKYLLVDTCVMTSCLFELSFAFTIVLLLRFVILRKLSLYSSTTDYNQRAIVQHVPCWEREFVLNRFSENILANKMTILVMQFTLIIAFGFACPPAILIVLFFNMYDMRRDAELFTLHYRRPLFLKNKSFSIWSEILKLMVYLAIVVNVVSFVCSTDTIETFIREQRKSTAYIHVAMDVAIGKDELTVDELRTYQYIYIFVFEIIMAAIYVIMQYIFSIDVDEKKIPNRRELENNNE
ncbi:Anoctamin-5 [Papilio machaon]|uniref:Anoctamin n=1 Tax=Papilio machaon TaxID=76193 RepID=A0A0N1IJG4_PAPMA|nr:Anoctamin-5 [Papilio machaon]